MRKFSILTTVAVSLTAFMPASDCVAQWPGATRGKDHKHILEIGGAAYDRPGVESSTPLITEAVTGETLFDAEDATGVGGAAGLDIKYQFETRHGRTWRFRSIVADFDVANEITAAAGLRSPLLGVDEFGEPIESDRISYEYDSRLLSFELMSCRTVAPGINFFSGPRYVSLREETRTQVDGEIDFGNGIPVVDATQFDSTFADNGLIGLQAGLEITIPISRYVYGETFIRGGGYYNPTEVSRTTQQLAAGQFIDPVLNVSRETKSTGSFLGEIGGRLFFDFVPDAVSGYVGYEATWIDGIALAPAQLLTPIDTVDTANTLFYQAINFGVRMKF